MNPNQNNRTPISENQIIEQTSELALESITGAVCHVVPEWASSPLLTGFDGRYWNLGE